MKNKSVGLLSQTVLIFLLLIVFIISVFEPSFVLLVRILMGLSLLSMAYNNIIIYKRKYCTIIYIIFSVIIFLSIILDYTL